jgi:hypothetical protein
MMSGRRQAARASAAVSMWSASALGSGRVTDGWDRPGPVASMRSRGISIAAGHLRPARMADSVCPTARDTSPGLATRWDLGEHGCQGAGLVADLVEEAVAAAGVGQRHAGADEEHGHGIGEGLEQGRERVEHGRPGGGDDDVDLTGHACRAVGHVTGTLFVPG